MDNNLTFLDTEEPEAETVETRAEPEAPVEQPEAEAKDERPHDGRFAPKQAEGPKPEPVMVPLQALHEARDRARDLEARLVAATQPTQQPEGPDVFSDPEGFKDDIVGTMSEQLYAQTLNWSHKFAVQQHGPEAVEQAVEWGEQRCAADPSFNQQVRANPDPIGFAVEQYKREQIVSQVDHGEYQQFQAWKAAQAQAQQQPTLQQEQPQTPPRSLASLPSSGGAGHVPAGPGQAFDTLFTQ